MKIITGDKFKELAKWFYVPQNSNYRDDYDGLKNTLDWTLLKNNDIVYTHTHHAEALMNELVTGKISKYFYLVTHNSDCNISDEILPWNVVKWYSTNVNVNNSRIQAIPIGLENDRWFRNLGKKAQMMDAYRSRKDIRNLVYMNHNIATNVQERMPLYTMFEDKPWVTSSRGKNGSNFNDYIMNVYNHHFVICPEGNGIDTHRTWETLYMGTIPIEKRNKNNVFFSKDFPMVLVDDWSEVTEHFLQKELKRIQAVKFDREKLYFNYWKNKILKHE